MANRYIYYRCSTDKQDDKQQFHCVTSYLESQGIGVERITGKVTEHASGAKSHKDRKLGELLKICKSGDYIYISELSRLGRSMTDLSNIVNDCCERGVIIIQCKDGMQIENKTVGGKAVLFALSLAAEIELSNIRQRTQMKLDSIKQEIAENGGWVSKKSGKYRTHLGSPKGDAAYNKDMSEAHKKNHSNAVEWRSKSPGFKWVKQRVAEGWSNSRMIDEFNALHEISPETFCAPMGGKITLPTLKRWRWAILAGE